MIYQPCSQLRAALGAPLIKDTLIRDTMIEDDDEDSYEDDEEFDDDDFDEDELDLPGYGDILEDNYSDDMGGEA